MALLDIFKGKRLGRRRIEPPRDTIAFPNLIQPNGTQTSRKRLAFKPTPRNLRWFSLNPYARRAINAIKNPIAMLEWEIVPVEEVKLNAELERQVEIARRERGGVRRGRVALRHEQRRPAIAR